jgi:hypothetical protein
VTYFIATALLFAQEVYCHGVKDEGYAICTNKTYIGLWGADAQGLRRRRGLPNNANLRDYATTTELNQIAFTEDLSGKRIKMVNAQGNNDCSKNCFEVAQKVANFTRDVLSA